MLRINVPTPETILYTARIDVQIGDINYGGHLANAMKRAYAGWPRWVLPNWTQAARG